MNEARRSRDALRHMAEFAEEAMRHGQGLTPESFRNNRVLQLAVTRLVELIGEAATRVNAEDRQGIASLPWREITGLRHRLIHGYDAVDAEVVWQTLTEELPALARSLREYLDARRNLPAPKVLQLLIAPAPDAGMVEVEEVYAETGKGLRGDRYHTGTGTFSHRVPHDDFEVTLVERARIEDFARETGLPFGVKEARRNIVTEGIDLNALVGKRVRVGGAVVEGIRLCEPCKHLAAQTFPETLTGLKGRGGLRARIVQDGVIRVGDAVEAL